MYNTYLYLSLYIYIYIYIHIYQVVPVLAAAGVVAGIARAREPLADAAEHNDNTNANNI